MEDPPTHIRGDLLYAALLFLDDLCSLNEDQREHLRYAHILQLLQFDGFEHRFDKWHWYGQASISARAREKLAECPEETRRQFPFVIRKVAKRAVKRSTSHTTIGGLSRADRKRLSSALIKFFNAVACGEIKLGQLQN